MVFCLQTLKKMCIILRRKVLPSGECALSVSPATMLQRSPVPDL